MLRQIALPLIIFSIVVFLDGCKKSSETITAPATSPNLIVNGSFETDTSFSIAPWQADGPPVCFGSSSDVPNSGGSYSLSFRICSYVGLLIDQLIAVQPGRHVYRFEYSAKNFYGGALVYLGVKRADSLKLNYSKEFSLLNADSSWISYSSIDTIEATAGDSIEIGLLANSDGAPHLGAARTYFDLIELTEIK
jgi:hypothetical protein